MRKERVQGKACLVSYILVFKEKVEFVRGELKPYQRIRWEDLLPGLLQGGPLPGGL